MRTVGFIDADYYFEKNWFFSSHAVAEYYCDACAQSHTKSVLMKVFADMSAGGVCVCVFWVSVYMVYKRRGLTGQFANF